MRILVVSQYFWPENFRINDLCRELVDRGHDVTVLTGLPNYPTGRIDPQYQSSPERFSVYGGVEIVRVPIVPRGQSRRSLLLNYLSFVVTGCIVGAWLLRGKQFDVVFVNQLSPVTSALPAVLVKWIKRIPMAMWVLDLWPDSVRAVGAAKSGFVLGALGQLVSFIYRQCRLVLGQSQMITEEIRKRTKAAVPVAYLPSWAEAMGPAPLPAPEVPPDDRFTVMFAGNIGEAQDFPAILAAAEILRGKPVRFVVVGDGRQMEWVRTEIARRDLTSAVHLAGRFPLERMPSFFEHADALLVSLRSDPVLAMTVPGKVQSYLASGRPILAMLDGEGGRVVTESGAGFSVPAGDAKGLAAAVETLRRLDGPTRADMADRGRQYSEREFDRDSVISALEAHLESVTGRML